MAPSAPAAGAVAISRIPGPVGPSVATAALDALDAIDRENRTGTATCIAYSDDVAEANALRSGDPIHAVPIRLVRPVAHRLRSERVRSLAARLAMRFARERRAGQRFARSRSRKLHPDVSSEDQPAAVRAQNHFACVVAAPHDRQRGDRRRHRPRCECALRTAHRRHPARRRAGAAANQPARLLPARHAAQPGAGRLHSGRLGGQLHVLPQRLRHRSGPVRLVGGVDDGSVGARPGLARGAHDREPGREQGG